MSDKQKSCAERMREEYEYRMEDLRLLWAGYTNAECPRCDGEGTFRTEKGDEDCIICEGRGRLSEDIPDLGNIFEYGLSFDFVAPYTFHDQPEGYFRYQLSWGGPSDEFRIYAQPVGRGDFVVYKIEYWFLDWFDGARTVPTGDDAAFLKELFQSFFVEVGSAEAVWNDAMKDWEPPDEQEDTEE